VGSQPVLSEINARTIIESSIAYLQKRVSKQVAITIDEKSELETVAFINTSLFEWVIENLCKNAVDAMEGKGSITFLLQNKGDQVIIDVKDTGKGIPIYLQKTVFNPGYTTRKRGWGLGLSLAKRIIESYHNGQILVATSEPGKGTTFRIKLQKKL
jgi:signal transduction histidine kinase